MHFTHFGANKVTTGSLQSQHHRQPLWAKDPLKDVNPRYPHVLWQFGQKNAHDELAGGHVVGLAIPLCSEEQTLMPLIPIYSPVQPSLCSSPPASPHHSWEHAGRHSKPSHDSTNGCVILDELDCMYCFMLPAVTKYTCWHFHLHQSSWNWSTK